MSTKDVEDRTNKRITDALKTGSITRDNYSCIQRTGLMGFTDESNRLYWIMKRSIDSGRIKIVEDGSTVFADNPVIVAQAPCTPSRAAQLTGANQESELAAELFKVRVEVTA